MIKTLLISVFAVVAPIVFFLIVGQFLMEASGRNPLKRERPDLPDGLGMRWKGYTADEVMTYWQELKADGRRAEQKFLRMDLVFAVAYCSAFGLSLFAMWNRLDLGFSPLWFVVPVILTLFADWVETAVQLSQLGAFMADNTLDPGWIRIASLATIVKVWSFVLMAVLLPVFASMMICYQLRSTTS